MSNAKNSNNNDAVLTPENINKFIEEMYLYKFITRDELTYPHVNYDYENTVKFAHAFSERLNEMDEVSRDVCNKSHKILSSYKSKSTLPTWKMLCHDMCLHVKDNNANTACNVDNPTAHPCLHCVFMWELFGSIVFSFSKDFVREVKSRSESTVDEKRSRLPETIDGETYPYLYRELSQSFIDTHINVNEQDALYLIEQVSNSFDKCVQDITNWADNSFVPTKYFNYDTGEVVNDKNNTSMFGRTYLIESLFSDNGLAMFNAGFSVREIQEMSLENFATIYANADLGIVGVRGFDVDKGLSHGSYELCCDGKYLSTTFADHKEQESYKVKEKGKNKKKNIPLYTCNNFGVVKNDAESSAEDGAGGVEVDSNASGEQPCGRKYVYSNSVHNNYFHNALHRYKQYLHNVHNAIKCMPHESMAGISDMSGMDRKGMDYFPVPQLRDNSNMFFERVAYFSDSDFYATLWHFCDGDVSTFANIVRFAYQNMSFCNIHFSQVGDFIYGLIDMAHGRYVGDVPFDVAMGMYVKGIQQLGRESDVTVSATEWEVPQSFIYTEYV